MQLNYPARKRIYYPYTKFNTLLPKAVDEDGSTSHGQGALLPHGASASQYVNEISDYGITALAGGFSAGSIVYGRIPFPYDIDIKHPLYIRVNFTQTGAVSVGLIWLIKYGKELAGALIAAEDAAANLLALDTAVGEKNAGGSALENLWTAWGKINQLNLSKAQIEAGAMMRLYVEADVVDVGITGVFLIGLELGYTPQYQRGNGREIESHEYSGAAI